MQLEAKKMANQEKKKELEEIIAKKGAGAPNLVVDDEIF